MEKVYYCMDGINDVNIRNLMHHLKPHGEWVKLCVSSTTVKDCVMLSREIKLHDGLETEVYVLDYHVGEKACRKVFESRALALYWFKVEASLANGGIRRYADFFEVTCQDDGEMVRLVSVIERDALDHYRQSPGAWDLRPLKFVDRPTTDLDL